MTFSGVKKPNFSYTFAFEKRTHYELPFGQNEKAAFASPRSGPAPSRLQYLLGYGRHHQHRFSLWTKR